MINATNISATRSAADHLRDEYRNSAVAVIDDRIKENMAEGFSEMILNVVFFRDILKMPWMLNDAKNWLVDTYNRAGYKAEYRKTVDQNYFIISWGN